MRRLRLLFALASTSAAPSPLDSQARDQRHGRRSRRAALLHFRPRQLIFLSYEVAGFKVSDEQKIHLSYKMDASIPRACA